MSDNDSENDLIGMLKSQAFEGDIDIITISEHGYEIAEEGGRGGVSEGQYTVLGS